MDAVWLCERLYKPSIEGKRVIGGLCWEHFRVVEKRGLRLRVKVEEENEADKAGKKQNRCQKARGALTLQIVLQLPVSEENITISFLLDRPRKPAVSPPLCPRQQC